jgi:Arc/MetJ-type ribon-helix-helix transcriptional regulator
MTIGGTMQAMPAAKITVSLDAEALKEVDRLVQRGLFPSRSSLIQDALADKLQRLRRTRLARECAKLDRAAERDAAEEFLAGESRWPEY